MGEFPYAELKQALKGNGIVIRRGAGNREKLDFAIDRHTGKPKLIVHGTAIYDEKKDEGYLSDIDFINFVVHNVKNRLLSGTSKYDAETLDEEESDYEDNYKERRY